MTILYLHSAVYYPRDTTIIVPASDSLKKKLHFGEMHTVSFKPAAADSSKDVVEIKSEMKPNKLHIVKGEEITKDPECQRLGIGWRR